MENVKPGPRLITVVEAAREMGVSKSTLYDLIKERKFPCVVVKRRRWIDRNDIPVWIARHKQKSA